MKNNQDKVTIYEVADRAGVAISTVSRVLNNSHEVSEHTRTRVLAIIEDLQFRPDRTAKTLAQKQSQVMAVAIPTFTTPFHNELLKGVRYRLRDQLIDLLLYDLGSAHPERELMRFLKRGAVDGLLVAGVPISDSISDELHAMHAPIVVVGHDCVDFDCIHWDDAAGARAAVAHLAEQGHRRIGLLRPHTDSQLLDGRLKGYREALAAADLPLDENVIVSGTTRKHAGFSEEAGYEAMQTLLEHSSPVTAVFASSDVQAIGALKAIRDAGKRVPEDIAVVGYDDVKTSRFIGLSSVSQKMHEVGEEATEILLQRIDETMPENQAVSMLITPALQVRQTSAHLREQAL